MTFGRRRRHDIRHEQTHNIKIPLFGEIFLWTDNNKYLQTVLLWCSEGRYKNKQNCAQMCWIPILKKCKTFCSLFAVYWVRCAFSVYIHRAMEFFSHMPGSGVNASMPFNDNVAVFFILKEECHLKYCTRLNEKLLCLYNMNFYFFQLTWSTRSTVLGLQRRLKMKL